MAVGRLDDRRWDEDPPSLSPPRRRTQLVALIAFVATIALGAVAYRSQVLYGTPWFWAPPDRIAYCGRDYRASHGEVHGTPESLTAEVRGNPEWRTVGRTLTLRPIQGAILRSRYNDIPCTMVLYVPTGNETYRSYALVGGP